MVALHLKVMFVLVQLDSIPKLEMERSVMTVMELVIELFSGLKGSRYLNMFLLQLLNKGVDGIIVLC